MEKALELDIFPSTDKLLKDTVPFNSNDTNAFNSVKEKNNLFAQDGSQFSVMQKPQNQEFNVRKPKGEAQNVKKYPF